MKKAKHESIAYAAMGSADSLFTFCSAVSLRLVLLREMGALRPLAMTPAWSLTTAAFLNFFCACELLSSSSGQCPDSLKCLRMTLHSPVTGAVQPGCGHLYSLRP